MGANTSILIDQIPDENHTGEMPELPAPIVQEEQPITPRSFPIEALNETQRAIVESVMKTYDQDAGVVGIASIAVIAGAIGRAYSAEGGAAGFSTYANIFSLIGADRSTGKGTSARILMQPIIRANDEIQQRYRVDALPTLKVRQRLLKTQLEAMYKAKEDPAPEEILVQHQRELEGIELALKQPPSLYTGSVTGAAMVEVLARNEEQIMLFSPEAGDALKVALGRYTSDGGTDLDLMLSGFSVESFSESRIGRGNHHLMAPCITTLWYAQPMLIKELLSNEQAIERGLAARFLYATAPRTDIPFDTGASTPIDQSITDDWGHLVGGILSRRGQQTIGIQCHPDSLEIFREFHNTMVVLRNGPFRDIQGDLGRAREIAIRIALGQCVADAMTRKEAPTILQPDHAERGVEIARYSYSQFVHITTPLREGLGLGKLNKILELCAGVGGRVKVSKLKNNHGYTDEEIGQLLEDFPHKIQLSTPPMSPQGGRPSSIITRIS